MRKLLFIALLALLALPALAQNVPIYTEQGGAKMVVGSGGTLQVDSGATFTSAVAPSYTAGLTVTGGTVNICADDTTADAVTIGSAKDTVSLVGKKVKLTMATGAADSCMGTATLTSGTVTVSTTCVASTSKIFVTIGTPTADTHTISVPAASIVDSTSFVINGLIDNGTVNGSDNTTTVNWVIFNPK